MNSLFAETALLPDGWASGVRVELAGGRITEVEAGAAAKAGDERVAILIPGMPNLHSHAFQRGMAGLAETRGPGADSFWSWREVMYRFALSMTPDHVEAVAAQLYAEMLEAGFTRVGEFHYLHHDVDGRPYADIAEMAGRIAAAATETGIGLTLLPVFYAHSGFGGQGPTEGQRRFINDLNGFAKLVESSRKAVELIPEAVVGVAPHSLRAVTPKELAAVTALAPDGPIHIHAAEQMREVEDCIAWSGRAADRMAARQCRRRRTLVPDPRHPHDRGRDQGDGEGRRNCRPLPDHRGQSRRRHFSRAAVHRERRALRHRLRFQRADRRRGRTAPARIFAAARAPGAQRAGQAGAVERTRAVRRSGSRRQCRARRRRRRSGGGRAGRLRIARRRRIPR